MNFYEIEIKDIPKIEFVYNVEKYNMSNSFPSTQDLLEISLCLSGEVTFLYHDGSKKYFTPDKVAIITKDTICELYMEKADIQRHITFGVAVPQTLKYISSQNLSFSEFSEIEKRILQNKSILLPHFIDLGADARKIENLISKALIFFYSNTPGDNIRCLSVWFELCAFLTQISLKKLRQMFNKYLPSDELYAENARRYINGHITEIIRIEQLADYVGISQGYLQNIFKKMTGLTIIEYINREKVELVKKITLNSRINLTDAAKITGIEDVAYMSRLFKKVTGISFKQYQIANKKKIR